MGGSGVPALLLCCMHHFGNNVFYFHSPLFGIKVVMLAAQMFVPLARALQPVLLLPMCLLPCCPMCAAVCLPHTCTYWWTF
jgi:hypothetical protein